MPYPLKPNRRIPKGIASLVAGLEQQMGCALPRDLRRFFLTQNGGEPTTRRGFSIPAVEGTRDIAPGCTHFVGEVGEYLKLGSGMGSVGDFHRDLRDDGFGEKAICPFAKEYYLNGTFICNCLEGPSFGSIHLYFYEEHGMYGPDFTPAMLITDPPVWLLPVAPSFTAFLATLTERPRGKQGPEGWI